MLSLRRPHLLAHLASALTLVCATGCSRFSHQYEAWNQALRDETHSRPQNLGAMTPERRKNVVDVWKNDLARISEIVALAEREIASHPELLVERKAETDSLRTRMDLFLDGAVQVYWTLNTQEKTSVRAELNLIGKKTNPAVVEALETEAIERAENNARKI